MFSPLRASIIISGILLLYVPFSSTTATLVTSPLVNNTVSAANQTVTRQPNQTITQQPNQTLTEAEIKANQTVTGAEIKANQTLTNAQIKANQTLTNAQIKANQTLTRAFTELPGSIAGALVAAIVLVLALPVLADLLLAHYRQFKLKIIDRPLGMPGLYRSQMALGLIAVVSIVVVYLVALVSFYIQTQGPGATALINVLQNLAAILGTALATVIAFYFGIRGAESATDRALTAVGLSSGAKSEPNQKGPPKIIGKYPADGHREVKLNSNIIATFDKQMDGSTITKDTFTLRKDGAPTGVEAEEINLQGQNQAVFNPKRDLEKNTKYIVKVTGEVKDKLGNKMLSDETWSFSTAA
jgi:hypothetical protein